MTLYKAHKHYQQGSAAVCSGTDLSINTKQAQWAEIAGGRVFRYSTCQVCYRAVAIYQQPTTTTATTEKIYKNVILRSLARQLEDNQPSAVAQVKVKRPDNFIYCQGDYLED